MTNSLEGVRVLVTGASSGIGEATVREFAAAGSRVAAVARRADRLGRLEREVRSNGGSVITIVADVTSPGAVDSAVQACVTDLGGLDIVINNAGMMMAGPVIDAPVGEWDRMIDVNIRGMMYVARFALPHLVVAASGPRGVADLVNVASISGRRSLPGSAVYNATKYAVVGFSEAVRQEVAPSGVRVCTLEPGSVETEFSLHSRPEIRDAPNPGFVGFERLTAAGIAEAILFVVSRPLPMVINEMLMRPIGQLA
jgi:NADP-dependent 3-hydroxy acid dehydrogenase YdfG